MNRRRATGVLAGSAIMALHPSLASSKAFKEDAEPKVRTGMGLVIYDCKIRRNWLRRRHPEKDLFEPMTFLRHCQELGAGGMQASLGILEKEKVRILREHASENNLFIEAIIKPPKNKSDMTRFVAEIQTAKEAGARAVRTTIIPGRRYERFKTLAEFRDYENRGKRMLELAAPIVEKFSIPLAVENHKDQRLEERVRLFQHLDSPFIGACLDTGNSFALLDGAYEPIETLAPFALSVHLKDQSLQEYDDGFLLGDIPLGQGSFDLPRMVKIIQKAKPKIRFSLELITRDPLKVPCLTKQFFETLPAVPASQLARTLNFVRRNPAKLQQVSRLSDEDQVKLEDANVRDSIRFAAEKLKI